LASITERSIAGNGKAGTFTVEQENEETGVFRKSVIMDT